MATLEELDFEARSFERLYFDRHYFGHYAAISVGLPTQQTHCVLVENTVRGGPDWIVWRQSRRIKQRMKQHYRVLSTLRIPGGIPHLEQCAQIRKWLVSDKEDIRIRVVLDGSIIRSAAAGVWSREIKLVQTFYNVEPDELRSELMRALNLSEVTYGTDLALAADLDCSVPSDSRALAIAINACKSRVSVHELRI